MPTHRTVSWLRSINHYVLVTTRGTAHVLAYIEPYLLLFSFLAGCGLIASIWNLMMMQRESMTKTSPPVGKMSSVDA
jgi:hypothetical protein